MDPQIGNQVAEAPQVQATEKSLVQQMDAKATELLPVADAVEQSVGKTLDSIAPGLGGILKGQEISTDAAKILGPKQTKILSGILERIKPGEGVDQIVIELKNMDTSSIPFVDGGLKKLRDSVLNHPQLPDLLRLHAEMAALDAQHKADVAKKSAAMGSRLSSALE